MSANNIVDSDDKSSDSVRLYKSPSDFFEVTEQSLDLLYYVPSPCVVINVDRKIIWRNMTATSNEDFRTIEIHENHFRSSIPSVESQVVSLIGSPAVVSAAIISDARIGQFEVKRILLKPGAGWSAPDPDWQNACLVFVHSISEALDETEASIGSANVILDTLTKVELRIVESLLTGRTLREASEDQSIKYNTARKYLQGIFAKTGVRRQTELIAKLADRSEKR